MKTPEYVVQMFAVNSDGWHFETDEDATRHDLALMKLIAARDAEWSAKCEALEAKNDALRAALAFKQGTFPALRKQAQDALAENARLTKRLEEAERLLRWVDDVFATSQTTDRQCKALSEVRTFVLSSPPPADSPVAATITLSAGPDAGTHPWPQGSPDPLVAVEARVTALEKAMRLRWGAYDTASPAPVAEPVCVDCGQPDATNGQHDWHHPFEPKQPEVAEKPDGAETPRPTCDHGVSIAMRCVKCKQPEVVAAGHAWRNASGGYYCDACWESEATCRAVDDPIHTKQPDVAGAHAYVLGPVPGHCYARVVHGGYCNEPVYDPIHATAKGKGG